MEKPPKKEKRIRETQMLMYFHTSVRNLGLYLSLSLAILGVSRAYRGKIRMYNVAFILLCLFVLSVSIYKNYYLIKTLNKMKKEIGENKYHTTEIIVVPKMMLVLNLIVYIFSILTLYREYFK